MKIHVINYFYNIKNTIKLYRLHVIFNTTFFSSYFIYNKKKILLKVKKINNSIHYLLDIEDSLFVLK